MKRRHFLKTSLGFGSAVLLNQIPGIASAKPKPEESNNMSYKVGEKISQEAFVFDSELNKHTLSELCNNSEAAVVVLNLYGGGAIKNQNRLGGIWCPDSFEDLHVLRFLDYKYTGSEVTILPVACAPVYSSQYYGLEKGVFLNEPDDSQKFKEAVEGFIDSTESAVYNKYIPVQTYYDFRLRLLFNRREDLQPGKGYGPVHDWQGSFRASDETQKYGTPTIWLLDSNGVVLTEPFYGNIYHSDPYEIRYTVLEVDRAIQELL